MQRFDQVCVRVGRGRGGVHECQVIPGKVVDETRGRVDDEGCAGHDQRGCPRNGRHGGLDDSLVEGYVTERANKGISFAFQQPVRFKGLTVRDLMTLAKGDVPS